MNSFQMARGSGKTLLAKEMVKKILEENPNALILLLSPKGHKVVTSENNTNIKEIKNDLKQIDAANIV